MKLAIATNIDKDIGLEVTRKVIELSRECGFDISFLDRYSLLDKQYHAMLDCTSADILLVIGGDGTILHSSARLPYVPVLGLNLGTIGFLAEVELSDLEVVFDALKRRKYHIEQRSMIKVEYGGQSFECLNDVVLTRKQSRLIDLQVEVEQSKAGAFRADGIIICTPTGSTAYALAAGGPIISPDADVFGLIPVNAHTLSIKPQILSDKRRIDIVLKAGDAVLEVDGIARSEVLQGGRVQICKAAQRVGFVRVGNEIESYYKKLFTKLNGWREI